MASSSIAKDSSISSCTWFASILSAEDDLGTDGDIGDEPNDDRVPLINEYDDHNSSAFTTLCALDDLALYMSQLGHENRNYGHVLNFVKQFQGL